MPWSPRYTKEEAAEAIAESASWSDVLRGLGIAPRGKNFATIRKWAERWEIPTDHLPPHRPRSSGPRFEEAEVRAAVAISHSWAETLRRLGYCPTGGNPRTLKRWAERWAISTDHFDPHWTAVSRRSGAQRIPLEEILVEGSSYNRGRLKQRLYAEGLKTPVCELCGQGEVWRGARMSLILDHTNGVRDDNRIENLRIVCPNCAATFETHCGRKNRTTPETRSCLLCGKSFEPKYRDHRYCSNACGSRWDRSSMPRPHGRQTGRPPRDQLLREIEQSGYLAVGRRYGVSDNAIRKWIRAYERERAVAQGRNPDEITIPTRTWPNRRDRDAA